MNVQKSVEKAQIALAWLLPRWLVYLAIVRAWADAATGRFSDVEATAVTVDDLLKSWDGQDVTLVREGADQTKEEQHIELLKEALGIIANKSDNWDKESELWRGAAETWENKYNVVLKEHESVTGADVETEIE